MTAPPTGTALPEDGINLNELSLGSSEEGAGKPTFDLNAIDEIFLKQVVKKFTVISGGRFYRSCRGAKEFVDRIKPSWTIPDTRLDISGENIKAWRHVTETDEFGLSVRIVTTANPEIPYEFCRVQEVDITDCGIVELKQFVLPVLEAVTIDHCKHIDIFVGGGYNYTKSWLFELLGKRKTVIFRYKNFYTSMIIVFLQNWLMGESTGTLERLTFYQWEAYVLSDDMESVLNQTDIQNFTKSCLKTRDGYVLQGTGLGRLRIVLDYNIDRIHFQLE